MKEIIEVEECVRGKANSLNKEIPSLFGRTGDVNLDNTFGRRILEHDSVCLVVHMLRV